MILGIVVYTGPESKLMLNSTSAPLKRSTVEKIVNKQVKIKLNVMINQYWNKPIANIIPAHPCVITYIYKKQ